MSRIAAALTRAIGVLGLLVGSSCDRAPEPATSRRASVATAAPPSAAPPKPAPAERPWRHPATPRIAALGDVHGDLAATRAALRLAGAIDTDDDWIAGPELTVVQTGDVLDRGDDERGILDRLVRWERAAAAKGGRFVVLNGNHETMNVAGDFRYVTPEGFRSFADLAARAPNAAHVPEAQRGRAAAFFPGGPYALQLAERDVVAQVGDTLFAHGGVLPEHVSYGIGRINAEVAAWMRGEAPPAAVVQGEESPVWTRRYSDGEPSPEACQALARVLERTGARRLVVGHTPQRTGISSACEGRVFRIDVGMARHYGGKPAVLFIEGDRTRVVH